MNSTLRTPYENKIVTFITFAENNVLVPAMPLSSSCGVAKLQKASIDHLLVKLTMYFFFFCFFFLGPLQISPPENGLVALVVG